MSFDIQSYIANLPKANIGFKIPDSEYEERILRVRKFLLENDLDVGLAWGSESRPGDVGWLTGYDPHIETTVTIVGPEKVLQVGGPSFVYYGQEMSPVVEYRLCFDFSIQEEYENLSFFSLEELLKEAAGRKPNRIGLLTGKDSLPADILQKVEATGAQAQDCSEFLKELKYHKSESELQAMRIAGEIASWAMEAALHYVKPGVRELEVAAAAEYVMKSCGVDRFSFNTIVMSGERIQCVGGRATNKIIEEGDMVVLSPGARVEGLNSTLGRTVVAGGKPNREQLEFLEICTQAYELSVPHLQYGKVAKHVDLAAREHLKKHGFMPFYSNVHNVGWTECMENYGGVDSHSEFTYPKGVSLMVDVGVFWFEYKGLPSAGTGFRLEDPFVINHCGETERLTEIPIRAWELVPKS